MASRNDGCTGCGLFFGACLILALASMCYAPDDREMAERTDRSEIVAACRDAVSAQLRAPGTASFPLGLADGVELSGSTARLVAFVDAENAFGGEARTHFVCNAARDGEEWTASANFLP